MGTRGVLAVRKNGQDKGQYNHFDSYPDGLGADVVKFLKETSITELDEIFDRIKLVKEEGKPTKEQIETCKRWANKSVSNQSLDDWYCLLYKAQGNLDAYKQGLVYMLDAEDFICDSLFCEYGYVINLDDLTLEFLVGFQREPQAGNRYGEEISYTTDNGKNYYPCKLLLTFPLIGIPEDAVKQMNDAVSIEFAESA